MMQLWRIFKVSFLFSDKGEHLRASAGFDGFTSAEQNLFYRELVQHSGCAQKMASLISEETTVEDL